MRRYIASIYFNRNNDEIKCFASIFCCIGKPGTCPKLTDLVNGTTTCSLSNGKVPSYGDSCSFICESHFKLIGSDIRTCQGNGSWSGTQATCKRGGWNLLILYASMYVCVCMYVCTGLLP